MIDGPHIFGFSPVTLCISLTSAFASARLVWSLIAAMNSATLAMVGLVLFSAIVCLAAFSLTLTADYCHASRAILKPL